MSEPVLRKLQSRSLKDDFIQQFEGLILSGHFKPGEQLPAERNLADMMNVSRPVVHEGLSDLAVKGLVTIMPRKGCYVNDYRRDGSLELLVSLVSFKGGGLSEGFFRSLLETRILFENEAARKAAEHRDAESIRNLRKIIDTEFSLVEKYKNGEILSSDIAALDYSFHLEVAVASKNDLFPLVMNSFKKIYLTVLSSFYESTRDLRGFYLLHKKTLEAIEAGDSKTAGDTMNEILTFGESELRKTVFDGKDSKSTEINF